MAEQPTLIDESFDNVVPTELPSPVSVVADYLSHDPSKDWTPAQIRATHAAGRGCMFLWETNGGRADSGAPGGFPDGRDAGNELDSLIRQVGYAPKNKLGICAAVDFDVTTQMGVIAAYFGTFRTGLAGRYLMGDYGEADEVDAMAAICDFGFQASAWSRGVISPHADAWQFLNGQRIADGTVDYDRLIHPERIGIWYPPGHALDVASATQITNPTPSPEDDMTAAQVQEAARLGCSQALAEYRAQSRADMLEEAGNAADTLLTQIPGKVWGQPIQDTGKTLGAAGASAWLTDTRIIVGNVSKALSGLPAAVVAALPASQSSYTLEDVKTAVAAAIAANPVKVAGNIALSGTVS